MFDPLVAANRWRGRLLLPNLELEISRCHTHQNLIVRVNVSILRRQSSKIYLEYENRLT